MYYHHRENECRGNDWKHQTIHVGYKYQKKHQVKNQPIHTLKILSVPIYIKSVMYMFK